MRNFSCFLRKACITMNFPLKNHFHYISFILDSCVFIFLDVFSDLPFDCIIDSLGFSSIIFNLFPHFYFSS